ncbi:hypothetical protein TraAM80_04956 [Trypanosoma rangeli]|uniref:Uncharacterized protein n=1 Tax=Trypanosoma rangeli TaxID=5698 RepID=A0A3R7KMS9_TRYRA|nr:uncharacterized protein TraAM80_04956 [Trypanosoma rangeli]RNF04825.1 hypothetical protein TraAM80_04956 [Trypanosoma rangeli]|eukprot:RNF04825.1 hypothetical protein TraAM80_04956 [Trypanosoma rangeli]
MKRCIVARCAAQLAVALREVVRHAPASGIPLAELEAELKECMQAAPTEAEVPEPVSSWRRALPEVNATHFVSRAALYPCNWEETMRRVAAAIPHEGVTEKELVEGIVEEEPRFLPDVSLGEPVSKWIQRRFPHIIWVSRSAANGTPIYRAVGEPLSPEAECITRVLQLLGRRKLPVYTDVNLIVPLLPVSMSPEKGKWLRFFEHETVRRHFDVDVEAFVRLSPDRSPSTVFVDATSVEVTQVDAILAGKGILDSLCVVKLFRRPDGPAWSAEDVIVQSFLEPEHAIGAAIASMERRNDVRVYVLCGDGAKERYKAALDDLLGQGDTMVTICTPTNDEVVSAKKR